MSDLDLAIREAGRTARMQMGKWRMVEKVEELALEIFDEFYDPIPGSENVESSIIEMIEEEIWEATI